MKTGVYDVNGNEIKVGDIVHYRGNNISAHGKVIEHESYGFAILDDRPKTKGRVYSLKNKGKYRIEQLGSEGVNDGRRIKEH